LTKLIKTTRTTIVTVYEVEVNKEQTNKYLKDEDQFIKDSSDNLKWEKVDFKEKTSDWIRIYTDKTPY
jgi:FtsZ-binding cell division protein ZapB